MKTAEKKKEAADSIEDRLDEFIDLKKNENSALRKIFKSLKKEKPEKDQE